MKKFILIFLLSFAAMAYEFKQGRLIISDSNTIANETAALLELNSTTKGLLIPRLTTTEVSAMGSVAKGIKIYNSTTDSLLVSDGNSFIPVGGASLGDLQIVTNTLESINTDQDINISPNGTGKVFIDTSLQVDSLTLNGSSINSDNNISILSNGSTTVDIEQWRFNGTIAYSAASGLTLDGTGGTLLLRNNSDVDIQTPVLKLKGWPSTTEQPKLRFYEESNSGQNFITLYAPEDITHNYEFTLPTEPATATGQVLQVATITEDSPVIGIDQVVLEWASGGAGDPTRINDGDDNTYVDTDELADVIRLAAGSRTIDFTGTDLELKGLAADNADVVSIKFFEAQDNGASSVALKAFATMAADYQITLPNAAPTATGQVLSVNSIGGGTDAVLEWATPAAGDTTRITDGGAVWVDTDEVASQVIMNIGATGGARAIWSTGQFTIDNFNGTSEPANIAFSEAPANGNDLIKLSAPQGDVASYGIWFPAAAPGANQILRSDATVDNVSKLSWVDYHRYCTMSEQYDVAEVGQPHDTTAFNYTIRPFNSFSGDCTFLTSFAGEPIADTKFTNDAYFTGFQWPAGKYHIQCHTKITPTGLDSAFYTLYNNDLSVPASQCSEAQNVTAADFVRFNCEITLASPANLSIRAKTNSTSGFWSHGGVLGTTFGLPSEKNGQCIIIKVE